MFIQKTQDKIGRWYDMKKIKWSQLLKTLVLDNECSGKWQHALPELQHCLLFRLLFNVGVLAMTQAEMITTFKTHISVGHQWPVWGKMAAVMCCQNWSIVCFLHSLKVFYLIILATNQESWQDQRHHDDRNQSSCLCFWIEKKEDKSIPQNAFLLQLASCKSNQSFWNCAISCHVCFSWETQLWNARCWWLR